jgi:glycosyltransferase involved in cell wall biosynthesis
MARGTAVIGCRYWGAQETVDQGRNGLLVEPHSVSTLAAALEELLLNRELRQRLTLEGRKTAEEFSWDRNVAESLALLEGQTS